MPRDDAQKEGPWPAGAVFTLGHSTMPIARFVSLLRAYDIRTLSDIRTIPRSRHNAQFNADALAAALRNERIEYVPMPGLGGLRHATKNSPNTGWRNESFRGFADYMQTPAFAEALAVLTKMVNRQRTAIMCAAAVPWRCHRSLVSDAISVRGIPVIEILSETNHRVHKLTSFARVEGTALSYPSAQGTFFPFATRR